MIIMMLLMQIIEQAAIRATTQEELAETMTLINYCHYRSLLLYSFWLSALVKRVMREF